MEYQHDRSTRLVPYRAFYPYPFTFDPGETPLLGEAWLMPSEEKMDEAIDVFAEGRQRVANMIYWPHDVIVSGAVAEENAYISIVWSEGISVDALDKVRAIIRSHKGKLCDDREVEQALVNDAAYQWVQAFLSGEHASRN